jgi:hypothetical protein
MADHSGDRRLQEDEVRAYRQRQRQSGGVRIFYFYRGHDGRMYFATLIRKSDTENLSKAERNHLAELAKMLKQTP